MADEPVKLDQVKSHLRIDPTEDSDDAHLALLVIAARRAIEQRTGRAVVGEAADIGDDDAMVVAMSVLMLVGAWYANREAVVVGSAAPAELPLAVEWLIAPLRRFTC